MWKRYFFLSEWVGGWMEPGAEDRVRLLDDSFWRLGDTHGVDRKKKVKRELGCLRQKKKERKKNQDRTGALSPATKQTGARRFSQVETTQKWRRSKMIELAGPNDEVGRCGMPKCKFIFKARRRVR